MTIYTHAKAQNNRIKTASQFYITQQPKIKDFHALAELTLARRARLWKPSTLRVNQDYLKNQIMPFFKTSAITLHLRRLLAHKK